MKESDSLFERLRLLSVREVAEILNLKVKSNGHCTVLERCTNKQYCKKWGKEFIPHYFKGAKMQFEPEIIYDLKRQYEQKNGLQ